MTMIAYLGGAVKREVSLMTIKQCFDRFLADRMVYCAPKTILTYTMHLELFFRWISDTYGSVEQLCFSELPQDDNIFTGYMLHLRSKGSCRNVTVRSYARSIKTFLSFCYEEDLCKDYLKKIKLPKDDSMPKQPLLVEEVQRLDSCFDLSTINGTRNYCIVHLMLDCGLRSQEVRALQFEHLDPAHHLIHVFLSKECKSRITMIPDFLLDAIRSYQIMVQRSSGIIFHRLKGDPGPVSENALKLLFSDLKVKSGIPRLHAHLLRHTFATSYLIYGGNLEFLRVLLGHYDYTVTKNYSSLAAQYQMLDIPIYKLDPIFFRTLN